MRRFESTAHDDVSPLPSLASAMHPAATGQGPQLIDLTVGHLQLARAARVTGTSAQVSCDGGQHWQRAAVTASGRGLFRVGFRVLGGCEVTLRVSATDAAGDSVTETITRAYAVAG